MMALSSREPPSRFRARTARHPEGEYTRYAVPYAFEECIAYAGGGRKD